ncbi:histidinol-phosphate transaminase [Pseudoscardovia radai]|uniref:histidinol-phosphate transaminase n=1 Tax=Pseudoscardovia radai TaxID=987066 RepID=UPI003991EB68
MSIPSNLPLRNDLAGEEPYGAPQLDVPVCLNVNENPYAPSEAVIDTILERVRAVAPTLNRYPDREHVELRKALAAYLRKESQVELEPEQIWAANGSNEIMLQVFQAFGGPGRTALGFAPTYSMYPEYARDTFTAWTTVPRNADFTLDVDAAVKAILEKRPSIVLITSPNNPTGTPATMEQIEALLAACEKAGVDGAPEGTHPLLVVDEAYIEFRRPGKPSATTLIADHPNLAVSRTMSKAFAYAGARVGYIAANTGVIDSLRIVRMPYHLSAVTQAVALAALDHTDEQLAQVGHLRDTRDALVDWFRQQTYKGKPIQVADTDSNFVFFGVFDDREWIFNELLNRGVLIRDVGPEGWLRVCMGTDEEMEAFKSAFLEVIRLAEQR